MQTHQQWLDGENEPSKDEKMRIAFENSAKKKGYSMDKDEYGRYEDNWLQEAWNIFSTVDFKTL